MEESFLRFATVKDAADIAKIYKPYVENTCITFEYEPPAVEEFERRITHTLEQYPYLVCQCKEKTVGYAYGSLFRGRTAYSWDVELSIYVAESMHGRGIGRALYTALLELLALQQYRNAYGVIASPNEKSEHMHRDMGFVQEARLQNSGYKSEKWWDVVIYTKTLNPFDKPVTPIAINAVSKESCAQILHSAQQYLK
ncbi:MAG: GNAT family N-acetyltransferase [Oscillospiraceae bacterium]|nr:GNAT family N-acetyltransferase [Oscillospiraceae bacterium]